MRRYSRDITLGSSSHRLGAAADAGFDGTPANERRFKTKRSSRRRMRISKESMNRLVMDYLVGKGYREVAEAFWRDSGTKPHVDLQSVQERMSIQQLLLKGQIQKARGKLASMDPEFLEKNSGMDFLLAKQELIELIKAHNIEEALQFAIKNLAPFGQKSPQFLHEIERTMSVIAFKNPSESPLGHLLEQAQRRRVADEVNSAILRSQKQELGRFFGYGALLDEVSGALT
ncbi:hypothetical protein, variant 3 [Phytophthora nicotianae CJ01A1]|uniref:CTLH domain-containing protein n=2 Tax=Phytophthora nicotianae TaxID=4792 RepID=W2IZH7_PHYNI|nr:hypothetical protein, variant 3 [Phytophthora nicotianae]ETL38937.1 hypothetical protein, variant 3 [Phytophthora nicotianae]ETL92059.1 hypothetical protein, variant 3 [Phytophthora nicotianae]ETP15352.1 hypothetical protein, variant 3 [Phytophthora nicotianae CJ01A1]